MNEVNQNCFEQLNASELSSRVAVIGAGLSIPASPSLEDVIARISKEADIEPEPGEHHWDFFQRAHDANPEKYFLLIRDAFSNLPYVSCRSYKFITAIPFQGFVTFNYDDQLPTSLLENGFWDPQHHFKVYPSPDYFAPMMMTRPPQKLLAIHGYISPVNPKWHRELILCRSDYDRHYIEEPARLRHWWQDLLLGGRLLFVGTRLREPGLHRIMEELIPDYFEQIRSQQHLHLMPITERSAADLKTDRFSIGNVIQRIHYDPIDNRHSGLLQILARLTGLPFESPSPRINLPKPLTIGVKM